MWGKRVKNGQSKRNMPSSAAAVETGGHTAVKVGLLRRGETGCVPVGRHVVVTHLFRSTRLRSPMDV